MQLNLISQHRHKAGKKIYDFLGDNTPEDQKKSLNSGPENKTAELT